MGSPPRKLAPLLSSQAKTQTGSPFFSLKRISGRALPASVMGPHSFSRLQAGSIWPDNGLSPVRLPFLGEDDDSSTGSVGGRSSIGGHSTANDQDNDAVERLWSRPLSPIRYTVPEGPTDEQSLWLQPLSERQRILKGRAIRGRKSPYLGHLTQNRREKKLVEFGSIQDAKLKVGCSSPFSLFFSTPRLFVCPFPSAMVPSSHTHISFPGRSPKGG